MSMLTGVDYVVKGSHRFLSSCREFLNQKATSQLSLKVLGVSSTFSLMTTE